MLVTFEDIATDHNKCLFKTIFNIILNIYLALFKISIQNFEIVPAAYKYNLICINMFTAS